MRRKATKAIKRLTDIPRDVVIGNAFTKGMLDRANQTTTNSE